MGHQILVVDDDPNITDFSRTALEASGFSVRTAASVKEALAAFRQAVPDLALTDVGLPDGSGLDICRRVRAGEAGGGERVPFLFLTARGDLKTRLECFKAGAQDYLQKPFAVEELLARVEVHLQIKSSFDDLSRRNYDLELKSRVRQDLTDMLVHDLKAPLTSIKGTLELIASRGLITQETHKNLLGQAGTAADFMLLMLNDILDTAQAEQTGLRVELLNSDVPVLLERLRLLFEPRFSRRAVQWQCRAEPSLKILRTDPNLLFRVLVNLVSNALLVSTTGAIVELEVLAKPEAVRFIVLDRGPGVPEAQKTKIFEKYVSSGGLETGPAPRSAGSGIGLYFCRLAAQALGGRVWVEDRQGGGSRFILQVPRPA